MCTYRAQIIGYGIKPIILNPQYEYRVISATHQATKANAKPDESDVSGINAIAARRPTRDNTCCILIAKLDITKPASILNT